MCPPTSPVVAKRRVIVLSPAVKGKNYAVGDLFLDRIRAGQYQEGVARVVLDFKRIVHHS
jgi:hypothetical protein